jgi:hypothetical protein
MPYLHGLEESLNNQKVIREQTAQEQILIVISLFLEVFFFSFLEVFFLLIRKALFFKVPFRGTWLRRENLEM